MTISLNKQIIEKYGLTVGECLYLIGKINKTEPIQMIEHSLILKGLIGHMMHDNVQHGYFPTNESKELIRHIIADSETFSENEDNTSPAKYRRWKRPSAEQAAGSLPVRFGTSP